MLIHYYYRDRHPLAPAWVHDMCMTDNYLVIVEPPLYFNVPALLLGTEREFVFMDWQAKDGTCVHVVSLQDETVRMIAPLKKAVCIGARHVSL